jgi:hypothetical protein
VLSVATAQKIDMRTAALMRGITHHQPSGGAGFFA